MPVICPAGADRSSEPEPPVRPDCTAIALQCHSSGTEERHPGIGRSLPLRYTHCEVAPQQENDIGSPDPRSPTEHRNKSTVLERGKR